MVEQDVKRRETAVAFEALFRQKEDGERLQEPNEKPERLVTIDACARDNEGSNGDGGSAKVILWVMC